MLPPVILEAYPETERDDIDRQGDENDDRNKKAHRQGENQNTEHINKCHKLISFENIIPLVRGFYNGL